MTRQLDHLIALGLADWFGDETDDPRPTFASPRPAKLRSSVVFRPRRAAYSLPTVNLHD
jgi:hypothetical protein